VCDPARDSQAGKTWSELRHRLLDCSVVAAPSAIRVRRFSGESLSAVFDGASGHTHVLNGLAAGVLEVLGDGQCHAVKGLVAQSKTGNPDLVLQTIISLTDQRLAVLVPPESDENP